eukprot:m.161046 g.161046  ORF g.161046 m.161046 type:complete len:407 (+) comp38798_c0_seq1:830-2050(+)
MKSAVAADNGAYTCKVKNDAGTDRKTSYLKVIVRPSIDMPAKTVTRLRDEFSIYSAGQTAFVISGNTVQLTCVSHGDPSPKIMWILPNNLKNGGDGVLVHSNGTLQLNQVVKKHNGRYTCRAENMGGSVTKNSTLKVYEKLGRCSASAEAVSSTQIDLRVTCPVGDKIFLRRVVKYFISYGTKNVTRQTTTKENQYRLEKLSANTLYTIRIAASYSNSYCVGSGGTRSDTVTVTKKTLEEASSPPRDISVCPGNATSVKGPDFVCLTWNPPNKMQGRFLFYTLYYSLAGSEERRESRISVLKTYHWLRPLSPFTNYSFEVVAFTQRRDKNTLTGEGSKRIYVWTFASTPSPPVGLNLTVKATSALLTWQIPADPNGPIDSYSLSLWSRDTEFNAIRSINISGEVII